MPIMAVLLAGAALAQLHVTVTVRGGSTEEQERLTRYGTLAKTTVEDAFPKILKILDYQGRAKTEVQIVVANDLQVHDGKIAWTNTWWDPYNAKGDICVPASSANPGDLGMIVHELMHVVQIGYKDCPGWLVEGIADYVRYYFFDPVSRRPRPGKNSDCHDSYGTTAAFLDWVAHRYQPNLLRALDLGFRTGQGAEEIFYGATRRSIDQLNAEWKRELQK